MGNSKDSDLLLNRMQNSTSTVEDSWAVSSKTKYTFLTQSFNYAL